MSKWYVVLTKAKQKKSFSNLAAINISTLSLGDEMQVTVAIASLNNQENIGTICESIESHFCLSKFGYMNASVESGLKYRSESENDSGWLKQL